MVSYFKPEVVQELMKEQNLLSLARQSLITLGADASFGAGGLVVNGVATSNGAAASIVAPIMPGSKWRLTTSTVFTTGSLTVTFGGKLITLVGGADEVWTLAIDKGVGDTINPFIVVNQVVATTNVDCTMSQLKVQLLDDFGKEQDIRGYFGVNDVAVVGVGN